MIGLDNQIINHFIELGYIRQPGVESRRGAVARPVGSFRFPSPLIKPDVPISGIRLSDWLHRKARGGGPRCTRLRRSTPSSPNIVS